MLWACLARMRDPETGRPLTKEQLLPEIGAFVLAGFDTSSHTIAWCLCARRLGLGAVGGGLGAVG